MPKPHLLALIARLVLGVIILGIVGFLLFVKLRPSKKQVVTLPSPQLTESPVVVITPTPEPSYPLLPTVPGTPNSEQTSQPNDTRTSRNTKSTNRYQAEERQTYPTITRYSTTESTTQAEAGDGWAWATATAGNASASAYASN